MASTSRGGIPWPSIGWYLSVRIDAYKITSSHPDGSTFAGPHPNTNAMSPWHGYVVSRAMDSDVAYLKRLGDVVREVSKAFEVDPQAFNRPLGSCKGKLFAEAAWDFHMKFLRWDALPYAAECPLSGNEPPRDPQRDDSGMARRPTHRHAGRGRALPPIGRACRSAGALPGCSRKTRSRPAKALSPSLRLGITNAATGHDDLSQGSDRFGQPGLDAAYLCPSC
jgi:hypothetical protein